MIAKVLSGSQTLDYHCLWTLHFKVWKKRLRLQDRFYLHLATMCSPRQPRTPIWSLWEGIQPKNQITEDQ